MDDTGPNEVANRMPTSRVFNRHNKPTTVQNSPESNFYRQLVRARRAVTPFSGSKAYLLWIRARTYPWLQHFEWFAC